MERVDDSFCNFASKSLFKVVLLKSSYSEVSRAMSREAESVFLWNGCQIVGRSSFHVQDSPTVRCRQQSGNVSPDGLNDISSELQMLLGPMMMWSAGMWVSTKAWWVGESRS